MIKPIAIHYKKEGFTERWMQYCEIHAIPYMKVNCYDTGIIDILKHCSGLMWHWDYDDYRDRLFAYQLLSVINLLDIEVFPDFWTNLHYDDKICQKYLLESIGAPLPNSYVFYERKTAEIWAESALYPKIFKLRTGAGSQNVRMVNDHQAAKQIINQAFSNGFTHINKSHMLHDRSVKFLRSKNYIDFISLSKICYRMIIPRYDDQFIPNEKGYVFFQDFMPNNLFDTRITIVGNRCFAFRRYNRKNDFRASGSGMIDHNPEKIDARAIKIGFFIAEKLNSKVLALDFLFNELSQPVVIDMSFGFAVGPSIDDCPGYWDKDLQWFPGKQNLPFLMVEDLIASVKD